MPEPDDVPPKNSDRENPFVAVPIEIMVVVGKARPLIRELVGLGENAVLTLDKRVEDPVELYVGDKLVARGEVGVVAQVLGAAVDEALAQALQPHGHVDGIPALPWPRGTYGPDA